MLPSTGAVMELLREDQTRSEEHTSELQSPCNLVCRLLLEKKITKQVTPEYLHKLKSLTFRLGLDISSTAVGNDFCHPPGDERTKELTHVKRRIDYADTLGA